MPGSVKLTIFVLTVFHTVGLQKVQGTCPTINGQHCIPPTADTCIIPSGQNGTGLTWFDMEKSCSVHGGRLVFMRGKFDENHLLKTAHLSINTLFLAMGMMMSFEGDNRTFWINPKENNTFSCGLKDTKICLSSSATPEKCNLFGCCWVNGKCQYPEQQWLTETNINARINISAVATTTERICVGLELKSRRLMAYNCSLPAATGTGYVCEYNCGTGWPVLPRQNITSTKVTSKPQNITSTKVTSKPQNITSTKVTSKPQNITSTKVTSKPQNITSTKVTSKPQNITSTKVTSKPENITSTKVTSKPQNITSTKVTSKPENITSTKVTSKPQNITSTKVTSKPQNITSTKVTSKPENITSTKVTSKPQNITSTKVTSKPQNITSTKVTSKPNTDTGLNRNKSPPIFNKMSLAAYFGLLPLMYKILTV